MALAVPLSRFSSRVGGGSAFFVRRFTTFMSLEIEIVSAGAAGVASVVSKLVSQLAVRSDAVKVDAPLDELRVETERQELASSIAESQARVAQELAIARRIETAAEVEMEEFYDYALEGKIGIQADATKISAGAGGSNKRVSRRVYRFKGQLEKLPAAPDDKK